MSVRNYSSTAAQTTLASGIDASATTLAVSSTTGFPATPFVLAVDAGGSAQELVLVTNVAGTTLTVTRGYDSTVAVSHDTGAVVAHSHAALDFREANAHVNATSGVHGASGALVGVTDAQALIAAALLAAHPVGDIKMSTVNVNPSTYLGGTWVAWGSGRVPVGVDAAQTEFNTVEKTGGAKTHTLSVAELPSHTHSDGTLAATGLTQPRSGGTLANSYNTYSAAGGITAVDGWNSGEVRDVSGDTGAVGSGAAHNNLQPFITCYMFKRTA